MKQEQEQRFKKRFDDLEKQVAELAKIVTKISEQLESAARKQRMDNFFKKK